MSLITFHFFTNPLLDLATKIDADFVRWLEAAKTLTPYATEFRYPGAPLTPEQEEASKALGDARDFLQDLEERLPQKVDSED